MGLFTKKAPVVDDRWDALNAEYQNYRRRTAQELEAVGAKAAGKTAAAFLPVYDDLQRALSSPCSDAAFYKGVEPFCWVSFRFRIQAERAFFFCAHG